MDKELTIGRWAQKLGISCERMAKIIRVTRDGIVTVQLWALLPTDLRFKGCRQANAQYRVIGGLQ